MSIVWGVELRDSVSPAANAAAVAMGTAASQAKVLAGAMKGAQAAAIKAQAVGDVSGLQKAAVSYQNLADQMKKVEGEAAAMARAESEAKAVSAAAAAQARIEREAAAEAAKMHADALEKVKKTAEGATVALVALGAAAAAVGFALFEGAKFAIESSEGLKRMKSAFDALGPAGTHAGAATVGMLRDLEKQLPQSEASLSSWARTLESAGMNDLGQLRNALKATASAEALVEGGGEKVKNLLAKLNEQSLAGGGKVRFQLASLAGTGIGEAEFLQAIGMTPDHFAAARKAGTLTGKSINEAIVKALSTKATGPLAAQMDELSVLETKAADSARRLFEDVDTSPFTDGVKAFFSVFDQANPSGQVLKAVITASFNAVLRVAGKVFSFLRTSFLHLMIWGLQAAIVIKHHKTLFEGLAAVITGAVIGAVVGLTVAAWALVAPMAAIAASVIASTWPFLAIGAAIGLVIFGVIELVKHWSDVKAFFVGLAKGAWDAGVGFAVGLVNGITTGIARVVNAAKNLAAAAVGAVRHAFDSHSPSRVGIGIGGDFGEGVGIGINRSEPDAERAGIGLSSAASSGASTRRPGPSGAGGAGTTVHLGGVTVYIDGSSATTPAQMRGILEEEFASLAERLAAMVGSAPDPA